MHKRRCFILLLFFLTGFLLVYIRIIKIQYKNADQLSVIADSQYKYTENYKELNYNLIDCNKKELLNYNKKYKAVIIPSAFSKNNYDKGNEEFLKLLYILKSYNDEYDLSTTIGSNKSEKIYFDIDDITYNKLRKLKNIKGFYTYSYLELDNKEGWKIENLLINTRNTSDSSLKNNDSLEMKLYNNVKNNKKPKVVFNIDMNGNITEAGIEYGKDNKDVLLTLDGSLQQRIKKLINSKYKKYDQIGIVLMEGNTGKIKALVQKDDTLPNVNIGAETLNGFFPGSIFKSIVLEAALEENKIPINKKISCSGEFESIGHNHGSLNMIDAFIVSCNDIYSRIGINAGFNKINELCEEQGLFNKVLGFEKEQHGKLEVTKPIAEDGSLGSMSIGQNLRITPIEAISIVNSIANNGYYVKPYIIDSYINSEGEIIDKTKIIKKKIISKKNADIIKDAMEGVVKRGTGKMAFTSKAITGGKTGTTERIEVFKEDSENKKRELSDGWFIGYFYFNNKYYSMVVFVQNINKNTESGGNTAAPIFRDVVEEFIKSS
ncbi:penicillin-binding transpeptidase domain-containing protein [Clostridium rectalis]|uniref:penicillin-binding transpeptidase domain-containing protein n=1 Tax=Clostridium rectalis TaxID=2040295 RepID=UPI000F640AB2|nr:penicillin-binding transpeptidase domain-containing protein [Clostridium rectalis]